MNCTTHQGIRLSSNEELRQTPGGTTVLETVLLVRGNYVGKDGARVDTETELPFTLWGQLAEKYQASVPRGAWVNFYGQLTNRKRDNPKGGHFNNVGVKVDRFELVGPAKVAAAPPRPAPVADDNSDIPF